MFFVFFLGGGGGLGVGGFAGRLLDKGGILEENLNKFHTFISYEAFISEWVFINPVIFGPFRRHMKMKNGAF